MLLQLVSLAMSLTAVADGDVSTKDARMWRLVGMSESIVRTQGCKPSKGTPEQAGRCCITSPSQVIHWNLRRDWNSSNSPQMLLTGIRSRQRRYLYGHTLGMRDAYLRCRGEQRRRAFGSQKAANVLSGSLHAGFEFMAQHSDLFSNPSCRLDARIGSREPLEPFAVAGCVARWAVANLVAWIAVAVIVTAETVGYTHVSICRDERVWVRLKNMVKQLLLCEELHGHTTAKHASKERSQSVIDKHVDGFLGVAIELKLPRKGQRPDKVRRSRRADWWTLLGCRVKVGLGQGS